VQIFWGKKGKGFSLSRYGSFSRMSQVIEKGCGICVFLIDLIPEARELVDIEVTCDESGLPTAGRS